MTTTNRTFELLSTRAGPDGAAPDRTIRTDPPPMQTLDLPHLTIGGPEDEERSTDLRLRSVLGEGGMGIVHVARQASLDRDVAIKQVRRGATTSAGEAILREARFMGSLEHPNIVPVHALGRDDEGTPVLVMKKVEGVSWRTLIREPDHPWWAAEAGERLIRHLEILADVCQAVHFAHDRGVLHRDLKPDNVMIGAFGEVYLMDWGVATRVDAPDGGLVGTPAYMAPEMLDGDAKITTRTDIFLLGACLHEVLTGAPPHRGGDLEEVLRAVQRAAPLVLEDGVPAELARICGRACHPDPGERFPTVAALRQALQAYLRDRSAHALAEAADARLQALKALIARPHRSPEEGLQVDALFTECRFGFRQALEGSPENALAARGLREAMEAMIPFELGRQNVDAATALLRDLETLAPDAEHRALREAVARARSEQERVRSLVRQMDVMVGSQGRIRFLGGMGILFAGITLYVLGSGEAASYDHAAAVRLIVLTDAALLLGMLGGWRWVTSSAVNRGLAAMLAGTGGIVLLHRLVAWALLTPIPAMLAGDLLLIALAVVGAGLLSAPRIALAALVYLGGVLAVVARPEAAVHLFGVTGVLGLFVLIALAISHLRATATRS